MRLARSVGSLLHMFTNDEMEACVSLSYIAALEKY